MTDEQSPSILASPPVLLEAYAAKLAYVMRKAFSASAEFQVFRGMADLAPAIIDLLQGFSDARSDPVFINDHLFVPKLTGGVNETSAAVVQVLGDEARQADPILG